MGEPTAEATNSQSDPRPASAPPAAVRIAQIVLIAYLLFRFGLFVQYAARVLAHPYEICAGEAILVNQGRLLASGHTIYPKLGGYPYIISHFTPVMPGVMALCVKAFGIAFWPGRLVSVLSALAVGGGIVALVWRGRSAWWGAAAGGLLFATSPWIALSSVELAADMLSVAFSIWGLVLAAKGRRRRADIAAGLLFALAVLTRQSQVGGLAAACCFLGFKDRRRLVPFLAAWALCVGLTVVVLEWATGGEFYRHIVTYTAGALSGRRLWMFAQMFARFHLGLLLLVAAFAWQQIARREVGAVGWYVLWAFVVVCTCAREGSGETYFIEAIASACAAGGVVLCRASEWRGRAAWAMVGLCLATAVLVEGPRHRTGRYQAPTPAQQQSTAALLARLKQLGPPILSEYNGLALQAGGKLLIQPYAFRMLAAQGKWRDDVLVEDILNQRFHAIVLDVRRRGRWSERVYRAVLSSYERAGIYRLYRHIGETQLILFVPRGRR